MKLIRLVDGKPQPEAKWEVTVHGYSMMVKCPCGTVWTTTTPSPGQRREEMCPSGCGHGIEMDARPVPEVEWVEIPRPARWVDLEQTLKDLTYPGPRIPMFPPVPTALGEDVREAIERAEPEKVKPVRKLEETDAEFRERLLAMGRTAALEAGIPVQEAPMPPGAQLASAGSQTVVGFDWFCGFCLLGYYSPDVARSDDQMRPLCRCGRVLNGAHEQPPGLRWVGEDDPP